MKLDRLVCNMAAAQYCSVNEARVSVHVTCVLAVWYVWYRQVVDADRPTTQLINTTHRRAPTAVTTLL